MYERILVPTDGSAGMSAVVEHAADLAASHGAEIHAVHVVDTTRLTGLPMETGWEGITETLREEGEQALAAVERLVDGCPVRTAMLEGTPSRQIVEHAHDHDVDLVVMGTHDRGGINRLLLGSVAERVVRTANVPVLTLRVGDGAQQEAKGTGAE
jgi:nucleotide-binding universal stress UspA family protein